MYGCVYVDVDAGNLLRTAEEAGVAMWRYVSCIDGSNSDWIRWQQLQWGGMFSGGQSRCFVPSIHGENKVEVIEYKAEPLLCPVDPPRVEGHWRSTEIFKPQKRRNP